MTEESTQTTKQCPFCAETIQAAAVVCRYCGRDLVAPSPAPAAAPAQLATNADDRALMQQEIARLTGQGWQLVSQTETNAQLKKPRTWNTFVLAAALVALLGVVLFGTLMIYIAIGLLVLAGIDYLAKKEQLVFLTPDQLRAGAERKRLAASSPYVEKLSTGDAACSACGGFVRPDATLCKHCKVQFTPTA